MRKMSAGGAPHLGGIAMPAVANTWGGWLKAGTAKEFSFER